MNSIMKIIIDKAIEYENQEKVTPIIDIFYEKLTVLPIQRAWRQKCRKGNHKNISSYLRYQYCYNCNRETEDE